MKKWMIGVALSALSGLSGCVVSPGYGYHHRGYFAGPGVFVGPVYPRYGYVGYHGWGGYRGGYCR